MSCRRGDLSGAGVSMGWPRLGAAWRRQRGCKSPKRGGGSVQAVPCMPPEPNVRRPDSATRAAAVLIVVFWREAVCKKGGSAPLIQMDGPQR